MEKLKIDIAGSVPAIQRTCSGHTIHVQKPTGQERAVNALILAWGKKRMCLKNQENKLILSQVQSRQNNKMPGSK